MGADDYEPGYPEALRMLVQATADAAAAAQRTCEAEVLHLLRCNRVAHREMAKLEAELASYRSNESRDELIRQHNAMKLEVERLRTENARLQLELTGTREQLGALAKAAG